MLEEEVVESTFDQRKKYVTISYILSLAIMGTSWGMTFLQMDKLIIFTHGHLIFLGILLGLFILIYPNIIRDYVSKLEVSHYKFLANYFVIYSIGSFFAAMILAFMGYAFAQNGGMVSGIIGMIFIGIAFLIPVIQIILLILGFILWVSGKEASMDSLKKMVKKS